MKKIIALMLCAVMLLALCACEKSEEAPDTELSLQWHLNRARELFKPMEKSDEYKKSLMENDFDVSIREIQKLLDEQGWV